MTTNPGGRELSGCRNYVLTMWSQKAFCESGGPDNAVRCM